MGEIPEDVLKAAIACWNSRVGRGPVVEDIALAILAERKRCAFVARRATIEADEDEEIGGDEWWTRSAANGMAESIATLIESGQ